MKKNPLFVWGWDRKIRPSDHRLSSLCKPRDAERRSSGRIFLSYPHTHDRFLYGELCHSQSWLWWQCLFIFHTCDFQQCGILTYVDSEEPVRPPFKLRNSKWCSVSSLTVIKYPSDKQRLWSDCEYAQAGLSLCWSHIPHCWKSHVTHM